MDVHTYLVQVGNMRLADEVYKSKVYISSFLECVNKGRLRSLLLVSSNIMFAGLIVKLILHIIYIHPINMSLHARTIVGIWLFFCL